MSSTASSPRPHLARISLSRAVLAISLALLAAACGGDDDDSVITDGSVSDDGSVDDGGAISDGSLVDFADADPNAPDAAPSAGCVTGGSECNNCIDDDGDGQIDGFDIHCVSSEDDDESSFATGIPGDNIDDIKQDCFFDGNSGAGDDKCDIHVCCLLAGDCPPDLDNNFDPSECEAPSTECINNCGPLTPPGCDCFGCCTICSGATCADVLINPTVSPDCDVDGLDDPELCPRCEKIESCGAPECGGETCVLCPGQGPEDLPESCGGSTSCPEGQTVCTGQTDCLSTEFCANGCCIGSIN